MKSKVDGSNEEDNSNKEIKVINGVVIILLKNTNK